MTTVKFIAYCVIIFALLGCHRDRNVIEEKDCIISDLKIETGECTSDHTYVLSINFKHNRSNNQLFDVYIRNNIKIGTYKASDLPIKIKDFKRSGKSHDFIKVTAHGNPHCSAVAEFKPPECEKSQCYISDLKAEVGECTSKNTYHLTINFKPHSAGNALFDVFVRDNKRIGTYKISDLPVIIKDFTTSGKDYDFIKICINDNSDCCKVVEFKAPDCK